MPPEVALFFGLGGVLILLGGMFNWIAKGADPELKERFTKPLGDATFDPSDEGRDGFTAYSVMAAKMGPILWRIGIPFLAIGVFGLIFYRPT